MIGISTVEASLLGDSRNSYIIAVFAKVTGSAYIKFLSENWNLCYIYYGVNDSVAY